MVLTFIFLLFVTSIYLSIDIHQEQVIDTWKSNNEKLELLNIHGNTDRPNLLISRNGQLDVLIKPNSSYIDELSTEFSFTTTDQFISDQGNFSIRIKYLNEALWQKLNLQDNYSIALYKIPLDISLNESMQFSLDYLNIMFN